MVMQRSTLVALAVVALAASACGQGFQFPLFGDLLGGLFPTAPAHPGAPQSATKAPNQPGAGDLLGGLLGALFGSLLPGGASQNQPGPPPLLQLLLPGLLGGAPNGSQQAPGGLFNFQTIFMMLPLNMPCPKINTTAAKAKLSVKDLQTTIVPKLSVAVKQGAAASGEQAALQLPKDLANDQQVKDFWTRFNATNQKMLTARKQFAGTLNETISRICQNGDKVDGAAATANATKRDLPSMGLDFNCTTLLPAGLMVIGSNGSASVMAALQRAYTADSKCFQQKLEDFATQLTKLKFDTMTSAEIRKVLEYLKMQAPDMPNPVEVHLQMTFMAVKVKSTFAALFG